MKSILYECPKLLDLPQIYSELFSSYSQKKCNFCSKVPKEPTVCLICGEHLCYKTSACCDSMKNLIQDHSSNCGSGVMILLNINSTYIYILRGKRSAAWASLYLDEHGEEDRDLKRGKPIYLSKQRYNLLKALWLSHAFDSQNIRWYNTTQVIQ
jgi:E3 ubiquitin-protein ligase UBR3